MKKELNKIIISIGMVIAVIGWLILSIDKDNAIAATVISNSFIFASVGACLVFAGNDTVKNIGYVICIFEGAKGISYLVMSELYLIIGIGMLWLLLGAIVNYLKYFKDVLTFFGVTTNPSAVGGDSLISSLTKLKGMQAEDVISEEEYRVLKSNVLESGVNKKLSLEDLKKWKKLLDQNVITEEEFASMKAKAFNK